MRWPAEEAFWLGVNLPWLSYGGDFGANCWRPGGGVGQPDRRAALREALGRVAGQGITLIRWFMLADGRAGLRESPSGELVGLDDFVLRDADAALEELDRAGLRAIFVLFDFHFFKPIRIIDGVAAGGRRSFGADPALRHRLLEQAITPLLERCGRHPSILAWDVINEPEWVTRSARPPYRRSDVSREAMRAFIRDAVELVHDRTSHAATVGSASTRTLSLVEGLGLDVYQAHWYDRLAKRAPLDRPVAEFGLDRPLILGEFPTRGSRRSPADILETARQAGYAGALAWSALATDEASDGTALAAECYHRGVDRDDILAFARRDWAMVAESKARYWLERKRTLSAAELLAVGDELRRHARAVRPDWPTDAERAADLATHERVTEALRAVPTRPR